MATNSHPAGGEHSPTTTDSLLTPARTQLAAALAYPKGLRRTSLVSNYGKTDDTWRRFFSETKAR